MESNPKNTYNVNAESKCPFTGSMLKKAAGGGTTATATGGPINLN